MAPKAAVEALGRCLGPARGRAQGGSWTSGSRFLSGLCSGGSRGARSRSERRAAVGGGPGRGDWCWWVVEGVFGEGVALGTEAPPDSEFISLVINSKLLYSENAVPLIEQAR